MKRSVRIAAAALSSALLLPVGAYAAGPYPDLAEDHWAYEDMDKAVSLGILNGFEDGRMGPEETLTWGQYLAMLTRAFYPADYAAALANGAEWDGAGYEAARQNGLILEDDFLPASPDALGEPILRQDAAVLLYRVLPEESVFYYWWRYEPAKAEDGLTDWDALSPDYQEAVSELYEASIVKGRDDGTFAGADTIKRCDGTALLIRTMDEYDDRSYGQEKTVTLHFVDQAGNTLSPDQTVDASVGYGTSYLAEPEELSRMALTSDYESVSCFKSEYTLVYRPCTRLEAAQADFWEAVDRGEIEGDIWEAYYAQDFWLWCQGENDRKLMLLFGSTDQDRYASREEAEEHMTTVTVPMWRLDGDGNKVSTTGSFSINAAIADDVAAIFTEIYNDPEQFPIQDIGGYGWRGDSATGEHNCGTAIDINATQNYQVRDGQALVGSYWRPGEDPCSIDPDGSVVRIFAEHGWAWGGDAWAYSTDQTTGYHDYMHFSYMGR